jgi:hypothetical protein
MKKFLWHIKIMEALRTRINTLGKKVKTLRKQKNKAKEQHEDALFKWHQKASAKAKLVDERKTKNTAAKKKKSKK